MLTSSFSGTSWCALVSGTAYDATQAVAEHPSNTVLRNDDPDGADMSWAPLEREVAGASDAPLPLLNVAALRRAVAAVKDADAIVRENSLMSLYLRCWPAVVADVGLHHSHW